MPTLLKIVYFNCEKCVNYNYCILPRKNHVIFYQPEIFLYADTVKSRDFLPILQFSCIILDWRQNTQWVWVSLVLLGISKRTLFCKDEIKVHGIHFIAVINSLYIKLRWVGNENIWNAWKTSRIGLTFRLVKIQKKFMSLIHFPILPVTVCITYSKIQLSRYNGSYILG